MASAERDMLQWTLQKDSVRQTEAMELAFPGDTCDTMLSSSDYGYSRTILITVMYAPARPVRPGGRIDVTSRHCGLNCTNQRVWRAVPKDETCNESSRICATGTGV